MEKLIIGGEEFTSRLFLGTGKFESDEAMAQAIAASGTQMATVAMKRIRLGDAGDEMLRHIRRERVRVLPNTSGVRDAAEAAPRRWRARRSRRTG